MDTLNRPLGFLESPRPEQICEFAVRMLRPGRLRVNRAANDGLAVTWHAPCNLARAGGLLEEPRDILRAAVAGFREMPANTIGQRTVCCGAGGGMLADVLMEVRMKGARPRVEAFQAGGASYLATPCALCKAQLPTVFEHYKVPAQVGGVLDLLGKAVVL